MFVKYLNFLKITVNLLLIISFLLCSQKAYGLNHQGSGSFYEAGPVIEISSVIDTTIYAETEFIRINFSENSYMLLQPGSKIGLSAEESGDEPLSVRIELLNGGLFLNMLNRLQPGLEILVNGSLVTVTDTNAGVHTMGFYWVQDGQLQIMSLSSGNQVTIRKGMYAQLENGGGEIISGNLSDAEIQQLSRVYQAEPVDTDYKIYSIELRETGEYKIREVTGNIPEDERD